MLAKSHTGCPMVILNMNRRISCAVAVSLLVHFLFLVYVPRTMEIFGKRERLENEPGSGTQAALAVRLIASPGEEKGDGEKIADTKALDGYSTESAEGALSTALSSAVSMAEEHQETLPNGEVQWSRKEQESARQPSSPTSSAVAENDFFFPRSQVMIPPVVLTASAVSDPLAALGGRLKPGQYLLRLFIDREGRVVDVRGSISPDAPDGNDDHIHERFLAAFASVRFSPARINGLAVNSQIDIEISAMDESPGSSRVSDTSFP